MNNNEKQSRREGGKKNMALSGLIAFGAVFLGTAAQTGVSRTVAKLKEKPTLLDRYKERKRLMYAKGEAIHQQYLSTKENIRESAIINAKVELNNKDAASELE